MSLGVGGDRATLAPPASLGRAHAHQVLKIGRPDSMTPERKYFALLHRDFNYVTRPVAYGTTTVRLADNARTSTHQGFVLECECVYYQKVAPVDKQLGSQRQLQVPDLLAALAIVAHLSSLYLRVADIGGHNLGWGIEPLAIGAEANHILQERALRHRPYVPLMLFDAGRWRESPAISFPGAKATKGLLGLIERFPDFHSWVLSQIRSYHNAQALCIAFLHRLRQYEGPLGGRHVQWPGNFSPADPTTRAPHSYQVAVGTRGGDHLADSSGLRPSNSCPCHFLKRRLPPCTP